MANYRVRNPPLEVMIVRGSEDAMSWPDVIISQGDFHNGGEVRGVGVKRQRLVNVGLGGFKFYRFKTMTADQLIMKSCGFK